jgi:hypothetical protein
VLHFGRQRRLCHAPQQRASRPEVPITAPWAVGRGREHRGEAVEGPADARQAQRVVGAEAGNPLPAVAGA